MESPYVELEKELQPYKALFSQAADAILDQDVSDYPIFVLHQQMVDIGLPLVEGVTEAMPWSVNVSTLEELATKKVIGMDKVDDFRKIYKDPRSFFCLFVLRDAGANFVFMPR